ncbi:MAG: alanine racemase [Rhizobiales bacterium 65-79]|jgi:D-serine deaminase-like pyridoxal phosphate-dependent protein|nr:D-TA family PLP-dependent enzyme [Hyphomicrobiales bacterium]OJU03172.1 MAG: alanine racemase [Rhizobiales bacterium 65-79]
MISIGDLDTPAVVVDRRIVEANLRRAQNHADRQGLKLRPHVKTHKLALFAGRQIELGAVGITCQKIGEAEVMAEVGIRDIFIPYNILGAEKLERLLALHRRLALSVTADSMATVEGYASRFGDPGRPLPVLVECDTGAGRCGVQDPAEAEALAAFIDGKPGLRFAGLMTYPPKGRMAEIDAWLSEARDRIEKAGMPVETISNGGTPDFYAATRVTAATEHRPGTYIYSDRTQVGFGVGGIADCALTVLATVVSLPTKTRMVLDAGSKALAADRCPSAPGHGHIVEYPEAVITGLSEEHAVVDLSGCPERPRIGDKVRVVPNHVCVVTNLFDGVHLAEDGEVIARLPVRARGRMS